MPNFRRKSCHQCRSSKLACDRKQPRCSRCERRSWPCRYSPVSKTPRPQADKPQQGQEPFLHTPGHVSEETASDDPIVAPTSTFNPAELSRPQVASVFENVAATDDIQDFGWTAELNDNTPWTGDAFSNYTNIPSAAPNININPDLVTDLIADINTEISRRANFEPSMLVDNSLLLRPRKWRSIESSMTSRMMRGDILTYPEMLINGLNLPPFISPPCCGDERQCQESGSHQCLPQPLVACASIIRMWQANSPDNKAFIWRTIYMEQQKLLHESLIPVPLKHESYEKETLIAAVQAAVLYTILHIEEVASIPKHYVRSLLITVGMNAQTMTFSMMNVRDMDYCHQTDEVPSRHEWICNQSMWRVTSFCYALNELLHIAKIPSSGNGGGPCRRVHLPSTRSLWTAKSNLEWQRQYAKQLSKRQLRDCYRIAHLREYSKYPGDSSAGRSWATDLDDWCLDHDELGTLIWMATKLDPV
ncbi:C6 finger domain-containing protein [Colletotrichum chrysophilum]|uniref:C6 finger domain-containing protein n=1 Tax=Colletotrichum chrysophilum TaxID=1836956 RepID=A0AAD9B0X4_9PEZI|nr:C6 finger domain-containing protein [Colletotrichum chrysophilum]